MYPTSLRTLLDEATRCLAAVSDTPRLDAEVLLAAALQRPRSYLFTLAGAGAGTGAGRALCCLAGTPPAG